MPPVTKSLDFEDHLLGVGVVFLMSAGGRRESTCLGGKKPDTTNRPLGARAKVLRGHGSDEGKVRLKPHAATAGAYASYFDAESLQERVGTHGPGVPMAALVLVLRVARESRCTFMMPPGRLWLGRTVRIPEPGQRRRDPLCTCRAEKVAGPHGLEP